MTREEAIECLNYQNEKFFGGQSEALKMAISALSENKGEDRPKGHWIYLNGVWPYRWECDQCNSLSKLNFNFCPDCGADMRGEI